MTAMPSRRSPPAEQARTRAARQRAHTLFNPTSTGTTAQMAAWRVRLNRIIFESDTPGGKLFDIILLCLILVSVAAVMLESVQCINARHGSLLRSVEWLLTVAFTVEYLLRLACVRRPLGYATSFFGVVDLLSVAPTYLSLLVAGTQALLVVRILRLLRIFRLFKLAQFVLQAEVLVAGLLASLAKVTVFLGCVVTLVVILGTTMYLVEGPATGFTSIPRSVYWAVVTLTTVGYGDIAPQSPLGQTLAAAVMVLGYSIIAVPTGIVSVELAEASRAARAETDERPATPSTTADAPCRHCGAAGHSTVARFCRLCGAALQEG
jgi:voltage-gated potassium channel